MVNSKTKSALVRRLNVRVGRRQFHGTHVCWVEHRIQYQRLSHLLDCHGGVIAGFESRYAGMVTALKKGLTPNDPDTIEKVCTKCSVVKPVFEFDTQKRGSLGCSNECKTCRAERDKARLDVIKNGVVFQCNKTILKRQSAGTHFILLLDAGIHKPVAHMLDEIGKVLPEYKGTYEGLLRFTDEERVDRLFFKKLKSQQELIERKKQSDIRKAEKAKEKKLKAEQNTVRIPSLFGDYVSFKEISDVLYLRFRLRIRTVCKKRGLVAPKDFTGLRGRTRSEYYYENFGYTERELIEHLEKTIPEGMTWFDVVCRKLHIDHRSPMKMFDVSDEKQLRNCYALGNLRFLRATENIVKSDFCDITDTYC